MILPSIILPFIFRLELGYAWHEDGRIIDGRMMKKIPEMGWNYLHHSNPEQESFGCVILKERAPKLVLVGD